MATNMYHKTTAKLIEDSSTLFNCYYRFYGQILAQRKCKWNVSVLGECHAH